jgi:oxygen-independent coproporphyrinogen-3 oxidase
MSGIYIHIPFCKQACTYCNFHFSTSMKQKGALLSAIKQEIALAARNWDFRQIRTVYFGGGTPSVLSSEEIMDLWRTLTLHFDLSDVEEVTFECNPDDMSSEYLRQLKATPINRLSVGVQSFRDEDLKLMHRAHSAAEAHQALKTAYQVGFNHFTIDLIYGIPGLDTNAWLSNLHHASDMGVDHLSCYALTVEPKTVLAHQIEKGVKAPLDDQLAADHFELLLDFVDKHGFEQYEISNFARNGAYSIHNSSYWKGDPYLGLGPSAHSFDLNNRFWNIPNNGIYIRSLQNHELPREIECLSKADRYNEAVMVGLRTKWGVDLQLLQSIDSELLLFFQAGVQKWDKKGWVVEEDGRYKVTNQGKFMTDKIASDLFFIAE